MKLSKIFFSLIALGLIIEDLGFCAELTPKCSAPATSISSQANDFCFLQFETDDIAHPAVQSCIMTLSALENNCINRTRLKEYRCYLLKSRGLISKNMTVEECINSTATEGLFVKGCEYPFEEGCDKTAKNKKR